VAHRGGVGLFEDQLCGVPPALAQFAAIGRKGQHVVRSLANGAQDGPTLGREGLGELPAEVRRRQRHAAIWGERDRESSTSSARGPYGGLIITASQFAVDRPDVIATLAARHKLPAIYPYRYFLCAGGLMSYGPDSIDPYRRAAGYVATSKRVLQGEFRFPTFSATPNVSVQIISSTAAAPMQVYALRIEEISGISGAVETQIVVEAETNLMSPQTGFIMQISW
jgi:hypothetical protein